MKQSQVKPGVVAMLSLGHRGAVRVTVRYQFTPERAGDVRWSVVDSSGQHRVATPRQLQPMPAPTVSSESERAHYSSFAATLRMLDARKGQTIDAGDVTITTTLHRLG